jgi:adenylyl cyclase-associated protein
MQVKGKVNSVMMDTCKKVGIVIESVVASFEAVNCSNLQIQCTCACPSLNIDKTDGAQARLDCSVPDGLNKAMPNTWDWTSGCQRC